MSVWDTYPNDYRQAEVQAVKQATKIGENVSVVGLSGAGKSNLLGYLANRVSSADHPLVLVDNNRLLDHTPLALFRLIRYALGQSSTPSAGGDPLTELNALHALIGQRLQVAKRISLLLDRFDIFTNRPDQPLFNTLRALRDDYKFQLTFVTATRRPLPADNELAELFRAHGTVERAVVISDRETGRSRGFGFVEMPDDTEGQAAITAMNGAEVDGRSLVANLARSRD